MTVLHADFDEFAAWVQESLGTPLGSIEVGTSMSDVDIDSMDRMELLLVLEEVGISVPGSVADAFETFGDVYEYVRLESQRYAG